MREITMENGEWRGRKKSSGSGGSKWDSRGMMMESKGGFPSLYSQIQKIRVKGVVRQWFVSLGMEKERRSVGLQTEGG